MFEHLDDPRPPRFDSDFRSRVERRRVQRRRQKRARLASFFAVPVFAVAGFGLWLNNQVGELNEVVIGGLSASDALESSGLDEPITVLVVGSDARPDDSEVVGERSDVVLVVRVDPVQERVAVLALPRDLQIGGSDSQTRLGEVFSNGPTAIVQQVSSLLQVDLHHYVEIDMPGFVRLVDLAGGVELKFSNPVRDQRSGLDVNEGCQVLDGEAALAFTRSRALEQFNPINQSWSSASPQGGLARSGRQQILMAEFYSQVLSADYSHSDEVRLAADVLEHITVDDGLNAQRLRTIFKEIQRIETPPEFVMFGRFESVEVLDKSLLALERAELDRAAKDLMTDPPDSPGRRITLQPFIVPLYGSCEN